MSTEQHTGPSQDDPAAPEDDLTSGETTGGGPGSSTPAAKSSATSSPSTRYAAYDLDRLRFVGGVHDGKADARKAGKMFGKNIEVREV